MSINLYPTLRDVESLRDGASSADEAISILIGHACALKDAGADRHAVALVAREAQRLCRSIMRDLVAGRDPRGLDAEMAAIFPIADYAEHLMDRYADAAAVCA